MLRLLLIVSLVIVTCLKVAHLASFLPQHGGVIHVNDGGIEHTHKPPVDVVTAISTVPTIATTTAAQFNLTTDSGPQLSSPPATTAETAAPTSTQDPNADPDDFIQPSTPSNEQPDAATNPPSKDPGATDPPSKTTGKNLTQPPDSPGKSDLQLQETSLELVVLFASIFMVYISFTKLIYHNVNFIKNNLTEPGVLMMLGILWELISRQVTTSYKLFPLFNSKVFFYLFLPSTVLESASLLSNKWLYINLLPILLHSIIGTLCYASALAFTLYSLTRHSVFDFNTQDYPQSSSPMMRINSTEAIRVEVPMNLTRNARQDNLMEDASPGDKDFMAGQAPVIELANLTLADCLVFGTILSSVDSSTILGVFRFIHVNEKLYYLILGENLMNNAVVLVIFNLLLEFFSATRLTVVKIYFAIIQFFITLIGSIFIGVILAGVALISVRLTKRLNMPCILSSYQNQCQATVETLLILKLAYLSYTVASFAGTSSILSLATFGILHDQYIKHNLNLRSQLTYKQVILATRTLGSSLVYPLLGMLLVDVASSSQIFYSMNSSDPPIWSPNRETASAVFRVTSKLASSGLGHLTKQIRIYWNFKFLSILTLFTVVYRFAVVILLSMFGNLFSSSQLKIKFREQILMAYGGMKGPLAFALVHKLIEHEEFRQRTMRNKHLFMYSILSITFLSTIIKGSFIRPLVHKMRLALSQSLDGSQRKKTNSSIVFDEINCKVTEYITHGMNSILGHRKSPYDRFVEFNEVNIKPWMARSGSNTNWLIVFYDNLVMDETLNANCFYQSVEQILPMAVVMQQRPMNNMSRRNSSTRRWQSSFLDTIAENRMLVRRRRPTYNNLQENRSRLQSIDSPSRRRASNNDKAPKVSAGRVSPAGDQSILKEFVMFNLKLEEARRRNQSTAGGGISRVGQKSSLDDRSLSRVGMRMLSTTSSEDQAQTTSSIEMRRVDRGKHSIDVINRLEEQLDSRQKSIPQQLDDLKDSRKNQQVKPHTSSVGPTGSKPPKKTHTRDMETKILKQKKEGPKPRQKRTMVGRRQHI